jgi:hypothetical protein
MANWFSVFQNDPKTMPGQGLASPDYSYDDTKNQYNQLLGLYNKGLASYGGRLAAGRNTMFDATLNGRNGAPGVTRLYLDAIRDADPEAAGLLDRLTRTADQELALDNRLDENQNNLIEQSVREGSAARGLGYGPNDVYQEMLQKLGYGDQLRDKRRANAMNLTGYRQGMASRPVDMVTQSTFSQSPEQNMFGSLMNVYGQNQENARVKAGLETKIGMHQADVWNDWFKTAAQGAMMCWAAREVFGATDLRWLEFRLWMMTKAPEKFRRWYLANGERWAERLKQNPVAKAVVKRWMERRIHGQ